MWLNKENFQPYILWCVELFQTTPIKRKYKSQLFLISPTSSPGLTHLTHKARFEYNYTPPDQHLLVCESTQVCIQKITLEKLHTAQNDPPGRLLVTPGVKISVHHLQPKHTTDWVTAG